MQAAVAFLFTYTVLGLVTGTAFTLLNSWFRFVLAQYLRQRTVVRVPVLVVFVHHGRDANTTGSASRCNPHYLDLGFREIVRLGYRVDAVLMELG